MKIAVTGGLGFIGSNFIRHILERHPGWKVLNIDKKTYAANPANLDGVPKERCRWLRADIADREKMKEALSGIDAVVHFAAETHVDRSILSPGEFIKTNVVGTHSLLEAALANKIKKFVHIGTDEVYGSLSRGFAREGDPLSPNSPYSASKAAADLLARSYFATFGLPVVITRCTNNFGPRQHPEKALPLLITNAFEDKPFPLYGDGKNVRDWIYVGDHASAVELVLLKGRPGEIYNIGGGNELANVDLIAAALKIMGKPASLVKKVADRPGHDRRYALDCSKIKKELGWKPAHSFKAALEETIVWYAENKNWWRGLKGGAAFRAYSKKQYGR